MTGQVGGGNRRRRRAAARRPPSTSTSTQALRSISAGSRPARSAATEISALWSAKPSGVLPYGVNHVFHASTCGSVIESIRGAFAPIISFGARASGGSSTASLTEWKRPSNVTRSPASRRRMIVNASSKRET